MFKIIPFLLLFIHLSYGQVLSPVDSTKLRSLIITSDPSGADIFIADSLYGQTPISIFNLDKHTFSLRLVTEDQKEWKSNFVNLSPEEYRIHALINKDYGLLKVFSEPSGCGIYVNDSLYAKSPTEMLQIPLGLSKIEVKKEGYRNWDTYINVLPAVNKMNYLSVRMESIKSTLSFESIPAESQIYVDNLLVDRRGNTSFQYLAGDHEITIESKENNEQLVLDAFLEHNTTYSPIIKRNRFSAKTFFYSALIPGLGQFSDGAKFKGLLLLTSALGFGYAAYTASNNYDTKVENYNYVRRNYLASQNEADALGNKTLLEPAQNDMDDALNTKRLFTGLFMGVYLYNLLDVLLFHTFQDVIELNKLDDGFQLKTRIVF